MCGIAGFAGIKPTDPQKLLRAMCKAMMHRGPDEDGYAWDGIVGLGMRRLSIIDLAGGRQPITNEDGSVTVVFNGEIYNYRELRRGLIRRGHEFRTDSDTEVLAHLYEDEGPDLVHRLRGMFAFAIRDHRRDSVLLARDRLGIKPLYYAAPAGGLAFGSELKVLEAGGFAGGDPDRSAVARFLALGYIPEPFSIYSTVSKLPPGHSMEWRAGVLSEPRQYWSPPIEPDPSIDEATAVEEIRRLLSEAVRYRLIADVPLGAFLSGGIDSAAVVAEMARQMDRPVDTYSIGFHEPEFNEAPAAAATAALLGTRHHELVLTSAVDEFVESVLDSFDEPFADSSALPTFAVSRLAATDLKVVLSGDGGDELFGGYTRYTDFARRNVALPGPMRAALRYAARALPHSAYGRNRLLEMSRDARGRYLGMVAHPLDVREGGVANTATGESVQWNRLLDGGYHEDGADLQQLLRVDLLTYLPGDILTKVDRMSMACSLEARVPLLDHHLVEFACRIPTDLKFRDGSGKWIFRRAVQGLVPDAVMNRPKRGFGVPLEQWLRNELRYRVDALATGTSQLAVYVDMQSLRKMIAEHYAGRRDHHALLWKLLVLDHWLARRPRRLVAKNPFQPSKKPDPKPGGADPEPGAADQQADVIAPVVP
jgi:asparagine synthase (glutamine-hydrolysing)